MGLSHFVYRRQPRVLAALSKEAAGDRALVAGDLSTLGRPLEPVGDLPYGEAYRVYPRTAASCRIYSGVVPQHPPRMPAPAPAKTPICTCSPWRP